MKEPSHQLLNFLPGVFMENFKVLGDFGTRKKSKGGKTTKGAKTPVISIKPLGSLGGFQKHLRRHLNKWNGVARTPLIKEAVYDTSTILGFLRIEALQLAQFHILRCFEEGIPVNLENADDEKNGSFWYWIYKSIRDLRFLGGLKITVKHPIELFNSAERYAQSVQPPELPTKPNGAVLNWRENNTPDWRTDCLKADAVHMKTNMAVMHSFKGYLGKLSNVVEQFLKQLFDFPKKIQSSFKNAIMQSLYTSQQLSEVIEGFPTLNNVDEAVVEEVQSSVIDAIRPVMSNDLTSITSNLRSVYDLRCLLCNTFPDRLPLNIQPDNPPPPNNVFNTLPFWSTPCESLADEISNALLNNSNIKEIMLLVRRSLDLMRMANESLVEYDDVGWKKPKNTFSRRPTILKLLSDAVFGDGVVDFSSQDHSKLLSEEEKIWCSNIGREWFFPSTTEDAVNSYLHRLEQHVRGLRIRQKVSHTRVKKKKADIFIKLPTLCPIASKRAVFIDIPDTAITKLARSIPNTVVGSVLVAETEFKTISKKLQALVTTLKAAKDAESKVGEKRKQDSSVPPSFAPEELVALEHAKEVTQVKYAEECWRALFKINVGAWTTWRFDARMITDGVSVFVQCWRSKTAEELRIESITDKIREKKNKERDKESKCGCPKGKHSCHQKQTGRKGKTPQDEELEIEAEQEAKLSVGLEKAHLILSQKGHREPRFFDPGASGHEGFIFDQEAFDTRHLPRGQIKHFQRISLRKNVMMSKAGQKKGTKAMSAWMMDNDDVVTFNENAPTPLKPSSQLFTDEYINPTNQALGGVYDFYAQNCVRRLRFHVASKTRSMLEDAVATICGTFDRKEQEKTVVVFGNAAVNTGKNGHSRICYKALIDILKSRCCLITVDEFRSSKLCSCCHEELQEADVAEGRSSKSWKVRVCFNRLCHRTYWQRDLNAAINLAQFFFWHLNGVEFPVAFRRGGVVNIMAEDEDEDGGGYESESSEINDEIIEYCWHLQSHYALPHRRSQP